MKLSSVLKIVEDISLMKYKPNMGEFRKKENAKEKYTYIYIYIYTYTHISHIHIHDFSVSDIH